MKSFLGSTEYHNSFLENSHFSIDQIELDYNHSPKRFLTKQKFNTYCFISEAEKLRNMGISVLWEILLATAGKIRVSILGKQAKNRWDNKW